MSNNNSQMILPLAGLSRTSDSPFTIHHSPFTIHASFATPQTRGMKHMRFRSSLLVICVLLVSLTTAFECLAQQSNSTTNGQTKSPVETPLSTLEWRSIGPANMRGRVADV